MGILTLGIDALKANTSTLKQPFKLTMAVTMHCNSRCVHCNIWKLRPKNELTLDEIKEFARSNRGFTIIELTGGEPFLRSDIVEIVKAFKENMKSLYAITMPTNSLVSKDIILSRVEEILKSGIGKFVVTLSLDGNREIHDRIRGVPGNYDKVISLYKEFKALKKKYRNFDFKFGYTIIGINQGMLSQVFSEIKKDIPEIRLTDFHINIGASSEHYYGNNTTNKDNFVIEKERVLKDIDAEISAYKEEILRNPFNAVNIGEYIYIKGLKEYVMSGRNPFRVRAGEASVYVDNWGNVYPSILINKKLGSLRNDGYYLRNILGKYGSQLSKNDSADHYTFCDEEVSIITDIGKSLHLIIK